MCYLHFKTAFEKIGPYWCKHFHDHKNECYYHHHLLICDLNGPVWKLFQPWFHIGMVDKDLIVKIRPLAGLLF